MRLHLLFQRVSNEFPNRKALWFSRSQIWTYQQLDKLTNRLAHWLLAQGVNPTRQDTDGTQLSGDRVGIYYPRGPWQLCFMLALSKIGAVYVPFNPDDSHHQQQATDKPHQKHREQLQACQLQWVFTNKDLTTRVSTLTSAKVIPLDNIAFLNDFADSLPDELPNSDELTAYIIFSSGTTGKPKGIPIRHKGLKPWFDRLRAELGTHADKRLAIQIPNGFDAHIWEYLMAWSCGGCAYVANEAQASSPIKQVNDLLLKHCITDLTMTPTVLSQILAEPSRIDQLWAEGAGLQRVYLTGEAVTPHSVTELTRRGIRVFNCYGPTELTFGYSMLEVTPSHFSTDQQYVAIGLQGHSGVRAFLRPLGTDETYFALDDLQQTISGELLIASEYVTSGYIGTTAQATKTITYKSQTLIVYPTADIVMFQQGKLFCQGRLGTQTKYKGNWLDVKPIQTACQTMVKECEHTLVFVIKLQQQEFVVVLLDKTIAADSKQQLYQAFKQQTDIAVVPAFILSLADLDLNAMPTTSSGKTDKMHLASLLRRYIETFLANNDVLPQLTEQLGLLSEATPLALDKLVQLTQAILLQLIRQAVTDYRLEFDDIKQCKIHQFGLSSLDVMRLHSKIVTIFKQVIAVPALREMTLSDLQQRLLMPYIYRCCFMPIESKFPASEIDPDNPIVFCLPPITGSIANYKILDTEATRIIAFKPPLLNEALRSHEQLFEACSQAYTQLELTELAYQLALAMQAIQPQGEFYLGGWSFGGNLAWAVAMQLTTMGRRVRVLFILDSQAPGILPKQSPQELLQRLRDITEMVVKLEFAGNSADKIQPDEVLHHTEDLVSKPAGPTLSMHQLCEQFFRIIIGDATDSGRSGTLSTLAIKYARSRHNLDRLREKLRVCQTHVTMLLNWQPGEWGQLQVPDLKTILFIAKDGIHGKAECLEAQWLPFLGDLSQKPITVPDNHFKILEQNMVQYEFRTKVANHLPYSKTVKGALRRYYQHQDSFELNLLEAHLPLADAINVAMVTSKTQQQHEHSLIDLLHSERMRSYEDVFQVETEIDYQNLFAKGNRLLILGRAGVGKSTFCRKLVSDWAKGLRWQQFKLVIWIPLRHLQTYPAIEISKAGNRELAQFIYAALENECNDTRLMRNLTVEAIEELLSQQAEQVLWILDGFDEVEQLVKQGWSKQAFETMLRQSNVVLTSRPNAAMQAKLPLKFTACYELLGFKEDDIKHYVYTIMQLKYADQSDKAKLLANQFIALLQAEPNLWGLAHIPINLEIMASVLEPHDLMTKQPLNLAQLYQKVINKLKYRYLTKPPWELQIPEMDAAELTAELDEFLAHLALENLLDRQQLFKDNDFLSLLQGPGAKRSLLAEGLHKHILTLHEQAESEPRKTYTSSQLLAPIHQSGLLNSIGSGNHKQHYFIHLTYQEYYAALALYQHHLDDPKLLQQLIQRPEFEMVLQFLVGMLLEEEAALQNFFNQVDAVFAEKESAGTDIFYENQPELFCRVLKFIEQCPSAQLKQRGAILSSITRVMATVLMQPEYYPDYNYKHRINLIRTLHQCPQTRAQSQIENYLSELATDDTSPIPEDYQLLLKQLHEPDYIECVISSFKESIHPDSQFRLLQDLLPLIDTEPRVRQFMIDIIITHLDFTFNSRQQFGLLIKLLGSYPKALTSLQPKLIATLQATETDISAKLAIAQALQKNSVFTVEVDLIPLIPPAKQLLTSENPSDRYQAALFLSENLTPNEYNNHTQQQLCHALIANTRSRDPLMQLMSYMLVITINEKTTGKCAIIRRVRNEMVHSPQSLLSPAGPLPGNIRNKLAHNTADTTQLQTTLINSATAVTHSISGQQQQSTSSQLTITILNGLLSGEAQMRSRAIEHIAELPSIDKLVLDKLIQLLHNEHDIHNMLSVRSLLIKRAAMSKPLIEYMLSHYPMGNFRFRRNVIFITQSLLTSKLEQQLAIHCHTEANDDLKMLFHQIQLLTQLTESGMQFTRDYILPPSEGGLRGRVRVLNANVNYTDVACKLQHNTNRSAKRVYVKCLTKDVDASVFALDDFSIPAPDQSITDDMKSVLSASLKGDNEFLQLEAAIYLSLLSLKPVAHTVLSSNPIVHPTLANCLLSNITAIRLRALLCYLKFDLPLPDSSLLKLLSDPSVRIRRTAAAILLNSPKRTTAIKKQLLALLLAEPDPILAIDIIKLLDTDTTAENTISFCQHSNNDIKAWALKRCVDEKQKLEPAFLLQLVNATDHRISHYAAKLLCDYPEHRDVAILALQQHIRPTSHQVKQANSTIWLTSLDLLIQLNAINEQVLVDALQQPIQYITATHLQFGEFTQCDYVPVARLIAKLAQYCQLRLSNVPADTESETQKALQKFLEYCKPHTALLDQLDDDYEADFLYDNLTVTVHEAFIQLSDDFKQAQTDADKGFIPAVIGTLTPSKSALWHKPKLNLYREALNRVDLGEANGIETFKLIVEAIGRQLTIAPELANLLLACLSLGFESMTNVVLEELRNFKTFTKKQFNHLLVSNLAEEIRATSYPIKLDSRPQLQLIVDLVKRDDHYLELLIKRLTNPGEFDRPAKAVMVQCRVLRALAELDGLINNNLPLKEVIINMIVKNNPTALQTNALYIAACLKWNHPLVIEQALRFVTLDKDKLRQVAITALGRFLQADASLQSQLIEEIESKPITYQTAVIEAMGTSTPLDYHQQHHQFLLSAAENANQAIVVAALKALANCYPRHNTTIKLLKTAMVDQRMEIQQTAIHQLRALKYVDTEVAKQILQLGPSIVGERIILEMNLANAILIIRNNEYEHFEAFEESISILLAPDTEDDIKQTFIEFLTHQPEGAKRIIQHLNNLLDSDGDIDRIYVLQQLSALLPIINSLPNKDALCSMLTVKILSLLSGPTPVHSAATLVTTTTTHVSAPQHDDTIDQQQTIDLLKLLGNFSQGQPPVLEVLLELADPAKPLICCAAIDTLGKIGCAYVEIVSRLILLSTNENLNVAISSLEALGELKYNNKIPAALQEDLTIKFNQPQTNRMQINMLKLLAKLCQYKHPEFIQFALTTAMKIFQHRSETIQNVALGVFLSCAQMNEVIRDAVINTARQQTPTVTLLKALEILAIRFPYHTEILLSEISQIQQSIAQHSDESTAPAAASHS